MAHGAPDEAGRRARSGRRTTPAGELGERHGDEPEARGREDGAAPVERRRIAAAALVDVAPRQPGRRDGDRQVDEEDRAPSDRVDEPAAGERADRTRDGARRRPRADGPAARFAVERRADQRQAGRHQECGADPLGDTGGEQQLEARRQRAAERCQREDEHAGEEGASPAPAVAGDAAEQHQRAERQQVGVDQPGDRRAVRTEVVLDRRQADVDHRAVDEGEAGAEDRRRQRAGGAPPLRGRTSIGRRAGLAQRADDNPRTAACAASTACETIASFQASVST